jgi:hypothetical protein
LGLAVCTIALSIFLYFIDAQRKVVSIFYDLDDDVVLRFKKFAQEFDNIAAADRIWNVDLGGLTDDWKHNAGATLIIKRKRASLVYSTPNVIKANIDIPSIIADLENIYFFPDVVLIIEGSRARAISYDKLLISWSDTRFVENERVPSDAQIVGQTWQYVNKKGGPDRRFGYNRQIPQVLYQQMVLRGPNEFVKIFHISHVADRSGFDIALDGLRRHLDTATMDIVAPGPSGAVKVGSIVFAGPRHERTIRLNDDMERKRADGSAKMDRADQRRENVHSIVARIISWDWTGAKLRGRNSEVLNVPPFNEDFATRLLLDEKNLWLFAQCIKFLAQSKNFLPPSLPISSGLPTTKPS